MCHRRVEWPTNLYISLPALQRVSFGNISNPRPLWETRSSQSQRVPAESRPTGAHCIKTRLAAAIEGYSLTDTTVTIYCYRRINMVRARLDSLCIHSFIHLFIHLFRMELPSVRVAPLAGVSSKLTRSTGQVHSPR